MPENITEYCLYQQIAEEIDYNHLPKEWRISNLKKFSEEITLYDYQKNAVENAVSLLFYYYDSLKKCQHNETYKENIERKKKFIEEIANYSHIVNQLRFTDKGKKLLFSKIQEYYPIKEEGRERYIEFYNFVNRMSFWMATGSGKTVVLIKLIEILTNLMEKALIPKKDILILTYRDDLIEQIKRHIMLYNKGKEKVFLLFSLKEYDEVKHRKLILPNQIPIFIYRSDLISDRTTEKFLSFEDVENNGDWYIFLDEAHKGEKEDSKRQIYYSVMSRNGFLFNFSATFTNLWDIITTVFNFNLDKFTLAGYGKNVYLSQQDLFAFNDEFSEEARQKNVLKSLTLLTLLRKYAKSLTKQNLYHWPLLVSLVNTVNTKDSDLELFFKEIEKIAIGKVNKHLFEESKRDLIKELKGHPRYQFGHEELIIDEKDLLNLTLQDLLNEIFHADRNGAIEVLKIPDNKEELVFKLKTSDKPFALIKIGDISNWLKEKLDNYEINETYENKSYFLNIDKSPELTILMGSRAFYEGWDSNRPNVMLFINIGKGDAKKYIIQSIGRGVRIQPFGIERKRLYALAKEKHPLAIKLKELFPIKVVKALETLFVFGTNKKNLEKILNSIKSERKSSGMLLPEIIEKNPELSDKVLLIPVYKEKDETLPIKELPKFYGNKKLLKRFIDWIEDDNVLYSLISSKIVLEPKELQLLKEYINEGAFEEVEDKDAVDQLVDLIYHLRIRKQEVEKLKELEDEIIHFKRIKVFLEREKYNELKEKIEKVKNAKKGEKTQKELIKLLKEGKLSDDEFNKRYDEVKRKSSNEEEFEFNNKKLRIKHLSKHYYIPILIGEDEKIKFITHIINVPSEVNFIKQVEKYAKNYNNEFDWWYFSKIDEYLDEIYIPYYHRMHGSIERFKPDFIFWIKKGDKYAILFVDPKGISHTEYEYKVDGFKRIFEKDGKPKIFRVNMNGKQVEVVILLRLFTEDRNKLPEGYKKYWVDDFSRVMSDVREELAKG